MPKYTCIQEWTNLITHKNLEDTDVSHLVPLRWDGPKTPASPAPIYGAAHWHWFCRSTAHSGALRPGTATF